MNLDEKLTRRLERARQEDVHFPPDLVGEVVRNAHSVPPQRRRTRRALAAGVVTASAVSFVLAAPAAADIIQSFFAQTGETCVGGTECSPGEEFIDTGASDTPEYIASVEVDYLPLAPGQTEQSVLEDVQDRYESLDVLTFESNFRADFENVVYCAWVEVWLDSQERGDQRGMSNAASVMRDSLSWPGPIQQSEDGLYWQGLFADAAANGDLEGVQTASLFNACPAFTGSTSGQWLNENRPTE